MTDEALRFEDVWGRITSLCGEFFQTALGRWFTYRIEDGALLPSQTEICIPRADFELAYNMVPLVASAKLNRLVEGPAYVWAILHDERISRGDW